MHGVGITALDIALIVGLPVVLILTVVLLVVASRVDGTRSWPYRIGWSAITALTLVVVDGAVIATLDRVLDRKEAPLIPAALASALILRFAFVRLGLEAARATVLAVATSVVLATVALAFLYM